VKSGPFWSYSLACTIAPSGISIYTNVSSA
jgi:hypothetical protein